MATNAANPSWFIRPYQAGDEAGIGALYELVYHKPFSLAKWRWKIHSLPTPIENEWVAVAGGQIIGHYAVTPVRFKLDNHELMVAHGSDAMTHPNFRRQGILSALGERVNALWGAYVPFQFGFPHEGWGSTRVRLGWQTMARLIWMKMVVLPATLLVRRGGFANARAARWFDAQLGRLAPQTSTEIAVRPVSCAGQEFDQLWEHIKDAYPVLAVRNCAWVQWRYLDMPEAEQDVLLACDGKKPRGYLAYHIRRTNNARWAVIRDCFAAPEDEQVIRALLSSLRQELAAQGIESIAALAVAGSPLYQAYRRAGFWARRVGYDFSMIQYQDVTPLADSHAWFVTGAEGDVV